MTGFFDSLKEPPKGGSFPYFSTNVISTGSWSE